MVSCHRAHASTLASLPYYALLFFARVTLAASDIDGGLELLGRLAGVLFHATGGKRLSYATGAGVI